MSTKTTFKRIALVAVAALGFGLLSSVPSNAAAPTTWALGTATANTAVVGQVSTITVPVTVTTNAATSDTLTVSVLPSAWPASSAVDLAADVTAVVGAAVVASSPWTGAATWGVSANTATLTFSAVTAASYVTSARATFTFTPDVAGSYTFAYFTDGSGITVAPTGAIKSGDTVKYLTVTAVANPATSVVLTQQLAGTGVSYLDATAAGSAGIWVRVNATDAAGALTRLSSSQLLLVTVPSTLTLRQKNNGASSTTGLTVTGADYGLSTADFNAAGYAWINVTGSTGSSTLSAAITGSTVAGSSIAVVHAADTTVATACATNTDAAGTIVAAPHVVATTGNTTGTSTINIAKTVTSSSYRVCAAAALSVVGVRIVDTNNKIFGNTSDLTQDIAVTMGAVGAAGSTNGTLAVGNATFTVAHSALSAEGSNNSTATGFSIFAADSLTLTPAGALTSVVTGVATTAASVGTITPAAALKVVNGGSITLTATFTDQYGTAQAGQPITASVSAGRNLSTVATNLVTNAAGEVTYTVTDAAPTSLLLTSTVTFTGTAAASATISWVSELTATTMTTSPSATTTTALSPADLGAINTATATASTGADAVTATVLDANGVAIAGMPVTLTLPADVTLSATSTLIAYTSATGVATWSVYTTKAGTYKFTATGGGLTKDFFGKWSGSNGRVVSVTAGTAAAGSTPVTIKVADAYGNGVSGVAVTVSATGGYFLGLPLSSSVNTNTNGEIMVAYVGSGTVTATGAETQMFHGAALIGTTAAAGWPAGVSTASATVDSGASDAQVAADAAAEATDAANAATDAANAAAEAADAATAAAQDAADAVAALSTQVSEMVNALKKQITALTNLVIKIQKKVKA
jgi:trimeric autotransporter adhesin